MIPLIFIEIGTTETLDRNARVTAKGRGAGKVANHTVRAEEMTEELHA